VIVRVASARAQILRCRRRWQRSGAARSQGAAKLVVNSGDTVAIETMMHAHNAIQPGTIHGRHRQAPPLRIRAAARFGQPARSTSRVPTGDVLEIRIKKDRAKAFGTNFHLPAHSSRPSASSRRNSAGLRPLYYLDWRRSRRSSSPAS